MGKLGLYKMKSGPFLYGSSLPSIRALTFGILENKACYQRHSKRTIAIAQPGESEEPYYHSEWPKKKNPSPYDVFNLKPHECDAQTLRKKYLQIAKIYHPDVSLNKQLLNHEGGMLTSDHKNERFKLLSNAYALLRDDKKRDLYDKFRTGWTRTELSMVRRTEYNRPGAYANRYQDYAYWNASSWEDYENLRNMKDPELRADKMKILAFLIVVIIVSTTLQGMSILNRAERSILQSQRLHDEAEDDLMRSYDNYGLDTSRVSRLRRFLWFRTFGLYVEKEKLDASQRENERILETILGEDYEKDTQ